MGAIDRLEERRCDRPIGVARCPAVEGHPPEQDDLLGGESEGDRGLGRHHHRRRGAPLPGPAPARARPARAPRAVNLAATR